MQNNHSSHISYVENKGFLCLTPCIDHCLPNKDKTVSCIEKFVTLFSKLMKQLLRLTNCLVEFGQKYFFFVLQMTQTPFSFTEQRINSSRYPMSTHSCQTLQYDTIYCHKQCKKMKRKTADLYYTVRNKMNFELPHLYPVKCEEKG